LNDQEYLIFTDLDGTLLDHDTYDWSPALPALKLLKEREHPVIIVTSKTASEVIALRTQLSNQHPFVVENGAAVFIPKDYFHAQPVGTKSRHNYWVYSQAAPRSHWQQFVKSLKSQPKFSFKSFSQMSLEEIGRETGLPVEAAQRAADREFSEPIQWLGDEASKKAFITYCQQHGAQVLQGGRFIHLTEHADKGQAVQWLIKQYHLNQNGANTNNSEDGCYKTIALGDSHNDAAMLAVVDYPVLVASKKKIDFDIPTRQPLFETQGLGPVGWNEAIMALLEIQTSKVDSF